jgi:molecular chaperone GrpE
MSEETPASQPQTDPAAELAAAKAKAEEYLDLAKRTKADFLNYQDRVRREKEQLAKYAIEGFLREIIPALDGFRHTLASLQGTTEARAILEGVSLVEKEFLRVLAKHGVAPIESAGKLFDPLYHEAVGTVPTADAPENTVVEEVRRGWMLNGRVLRPATVRVAVRPPADATPPPPSAS